MKHITFYLDFVSPYAYLAFEALPQVLQGHSYRVTYTPVLFAGLLKHHGQLGPAEIPSKRSWTYRQVAWLARAQGVSLHMPVRHPFNPLGLLRLALASAPDGAPNRWVCETIFRQVWQSGLDAADAAVLQALTAQLAPVTEPGGEHVKALLRDNTDQAVARGVFGVPTMVVDEQLFWGLDALPMLKAHLDGDTSLSQDAAAAERALPFVP